MSGHRGARARRGAAGLLCAAAASLASACNDAETASFAAPACTGGATHKAVVTTLVFTREEPKGTAPGFDLDGRVSDGSDTATCGHADRVDANGTPGIDNQLAGVVPDVEEIVGDAVFGLVQGAIQNGELLILLEMAGVDDATNDDCVGFATEIGEGRPSIGTDGVIEPYQTFDLDPQNVKSDGGVGKIEGSVMTAGPFDMRLPLALFDVSFTLTLHDALVRYTIAEDGRIEGMLGGGVDVAELLAGAGQGAGTEDIIPIMQVVLRAASDLGPDEDGVCRQLSAALQFTAVPAFVRE